MLWHSWGHGRFSVGAMRSGTARVIDHHAVARRAMGSATPFGVVESHGVRESRAIDGGAADWPVDVGSSGLPTEYCPVGAATAVVSAVAAGLGIRPLDARLRYSLFFVPAVALVVERLRGTDSRPRRDAADLRRWTELGWTHFRECAFTSRIDLAWRGARSDGGIERGVPASRRSWVAGDHDATARAVVVDHPGRVGRNRDASGVDGDRGAVAWCAGGCGDRPVHRLVVASQRLCDRVRDALQRARLDEALRVFAAACMAPTLSWGGVAGHRAVRVAGADWERRSAADRSEPRRRARHSFGDESSADGCAA